MSIGTQSTPIADQPPGRTKSALIIFVLCFLTIAADGYDLIIYGASVPQLLFEPGWAMTPATAGAIGSWTLLGMMTGFLSSGPLTDRYGRRTVITIGVTWFSIASVACALAPSAQFLGTARFLTGLGLGGVLPAAVVLTIEFAPKARRQLYAALVLTGFSIGGIAAALTALTLIPHHSWRLLFASCGVFLLLPPAMSRRLPESTHHLAVRGNTAAAHATAQQHRLDTHTLQAEYDEHIAYAQHSDNTIRSGYRLLLSRRCRTAALIFTVLCFCSQLAVYGLNTWLPEFMRLAGYPIGPSLMFFLVLQIGAVTGMLTAALIADRHNPKHVMIGCFLTGALSLGMLGHNLNTTMLTIAVAGAGLGTAGTTMLLYGYAAAHFPTTCRATAIGASMGIGRLGSILGPLLGGYILTTTLNQQWNFYIFALPLALAATTATLLTTTKT